MARGLHIGATELAALDDYVQAVSMTALEAAEIATAHVERAVRRRAEASTRWAPLVDHIQVQSEDGYLIMGVAHEFQSQAMAAEYGDEEHSPDPLIRTMGSTARAAAEAGAQHMRSKFGYR